MKTKRIVIAAAMMAAFSIQASAQATDPKVWAWDFPMNMEINAEAGQQALTCQMHYFQEVKEGQGLLKKTMIWYDTKIDAPGKEKTVIDEYGKKIEVPNALIIPLAKEAKVKKGDILLTHSKYHERQRAIVIDVPLPNEPVVCFLDDRWPDKVDSSSLPEKLKGEQLKPGSYNVIKDGNFVSGAQVAYRRDGEWKFGVIMQISGDKMLVCGFASRLDCVSKSDCKLIPFKEKIKKGDRVRCIDLDRYEDGYTVVQVDMEHGHIWTQADGSTYTHCFGLGDVTKVLDK